VRFQIPPLPYPKDALQPVISARGLDVHYEKHHKGYLQKLRELIEGTTRESSSLEDLVRTSEGEVFENAAQVWNHSFFWRCMRPGGGGKPQQELLERVEAAFGSYEGFRSRFSDAAKSRFGSGWVWMVRDAGGRLRIVSTANADNPLRERAVPLLTLDVWEHAYYLDHRNERARYVDGFLDRLIDWSFVDRNLAADAQGIGGSRREEAGHAEEARS
jgi:Fe-Mn family superoxide dismutase